MRDSWSCKSDFYNNITFNIHKHQFTLNTHIRGNIHFKVCTIDSLNFGIILHASQGIKALSKVIDNQIRPKPLWIQLSSSSLFCLKSFFNTLTPTCMNCQLIYSNIKTITYLNTSNLKFWRISMLLIVCSLLILLCSPNIACNFFR